MALTVTQVQVWAVGMEDRPGGLAEKLDALASAGVNLEFIIGRRTAERPGSGVVFVTPIEGEKAIQAAEAVGFMATGSLHSIRVEGPDAPGLGARIAEALANAEVNLRGISAAAIGDRMVCHLALDTAEEATQATEVLRKL